MVNSPLSWYSGAWKLVSSKLSGSADSGASALNVIVLNEIVGRASVIWTGVTICLTESMTTLPPP